MAERFDKNSFDMQGECPVCWWSNLNYDTAEIDWDVVSYGWTCNDCESEWTEWYTLEFYSQALQYDWPQKMSVDDEWREYKTI